MYENILLTVDLNEESSWAKALPTAVALVKALGARLYPFITSMESRIALCYKRSIRLRGIVASLIGRSICRASKMNS